MILQRKDKDGLPTAQQSRRKKEEELANFYLGSAGRSEARYREKGGDRERWVSNSARLSGGMEDGGKERTGCRGQC